MNISLNTSTCFGRIYSPSSGGTPYGYNSWYLLFFLDGCLLSWLCWNPTSTTDSNLYRTISTNCFIHTVYLLMMGCRYARNMYRCFTKYLLPGAELPSGKFWPSQRPLSISLDPGHRLSSFGSSIGKCSV